MNGPVELCICAMSGKDQLNYINVPGKGKLQTQIYETRMRIHCFFDEDEKNWLRLPIAWELYSRPTQELIALIKVSSTIFDFAHTNNALMCRCE
ncbi:hypothetical protein Ciccas_013342 [Cichlidogyrus casuarinus]|uniref:Uncharacterized protein n=1 Tax=Cichlidogyrus casuarinus TaxID=1844966 RepID=A0ABD2PKU6_9PLAT